MVMFKRALSLGLNKFSFNLSKWASKHSHTAKASRGERGGYDNLF